jgi:hypothetical protein
VLDESIELNLRSVGMLRKANVVCGCETARMKPSRESKMNDRTQFRVEGSRALDEFRGEHDGELNHESDESNE